MRLADSRGVLQYFNCYLSKCRANHFTSTILCGHHQNTTDSVVESKKRLIKFEYEWLRHCEPQSVPDELNMSQLEYLLSLHQFKRYRRMAWLDVSYQVRRRALQRLRNLQLFDGTNRLVLPLVGSEVSLSHYCFLLLLLILLIFIYLLSFFRQNDCFEDGKHR